MERFASCSFANDFRGMQELYCSPAGTVYKAIFKYDGKTYVLKERKLAELGKRKDIMNEVKLLQQLRHGNVVQCEGWFRDLDRGSLFIVLEYCEGGDLNALIDEYRKDGKRLKETEIWNIFSQICHGLCHLHENGIIHRDIKALNVLANKDRTVFKIGDLGVSRQLGEFTEMLKTFYGTPLYLSPELIENKAYNEKTDIWSLGIILYEMCTLAPPFRASTLLELAKAVLKGEYAPISSRYSKKMGRCIRWLLTKDFRARPHIAQVLDFLKESGGGSSMVKVVVRTADHGDSMDDDSLDGKPPVAQRRDRSGRDDAGAVDTPTTFAGAAQEETDSEGEVQSTHEPPTREPVLFLPPPVQMAVTPNAAQVPVKAMRNVRIGSMQHEAPFHAPQAADPVQVDLARVATKLRREGVLHRRLLQMRDFIGAETDQQRALQVDAQLQQCRRNLVLLDAAAATGTMPSAEATRLDVRAPQSRDPEAPLEAPKAPAPRTVVHDSMPVYLQSSPQKYKGFVHAHAHSRQVDRSRPVSAGAPSAVNDKALQLEQAALRGAPIFLEPAAQPPSFGHRHHHRHSVIYAAEPQHNVLFAQPLKIPNQVIGTSAKPRPSTAAPRSSSGHGGADGLIGLGEGDGLALPSMQIPAGGAIPARMVNDQRVVRSAPRDLAVSSAPRRQSNPSPPEPPSEPVMAPARPATAAVPAAGEDDWLFCDRKQIYKHGRPKTDITSLPVGPAAGRQRIFDVGDDPPRPSRAVPERHRVGFNIITNM